MTTTVFPTISFADPRKGLDFLYMVGDVAIAGRTSQFEVRYDLPERVIPAAVLATLLFVLGQWLYQRYL